MDRLQGMVGDLVGVLAALGGAYFFVGLVANLVQAQVSTVTGDSIGRARATQQGLGMVLLLCIAVSVRPLTAGFVNHFYGAGYSAPGILTSEAGVFTAFGATWPTWSRTSSSVAASCCSRWGQCMPAWGCRLRRLIGLPIGVGRAVGNLLAILVGLAVTLAAIGLTKALIGIIFRSAG